ncbi:hypothetical protein DL96DRAFT_1500342 [Flagelloscypha sp. PMI_526]|nr:hypothetical protein DL96DRAFT_1500342 [Flagelloscypha sp. PMI_526]
MTIVDPDADNELTRLWGLITELSEELNRNRHLAVSLYTDTGNIKNQALHSQTGFVLRKYNMDKTQEQYEAELERMNKAMSAENQGLAHDNKQLNVLIKEYEQGLEVVMSDFRNRAQDVQSRELSLIRHYEEQLLAKEEEFSSKDLARNTAISESLSRMSTALRCALRSIGGEPVVEELLLKKSSEEAPSTTEAEGSSGGNDDLASPPQSLSHSNADLEVSEREPWTDPDNAEAEHALEREIELARLERENEELRRLAGLLPLQNPMRQHQRFSADSDIDGERSRDRSDIYNAGARYGSSGGLGQGVLRLAGLSESI